MTEAQTFDVKTTTRNEVIDITALVRSALRKTGVQSGLAVVFCPHTTAGLTIQENTDPDVKADMLDHLSRLVPRDAGFRHDEENSDSHIKSSLVGATLHLIIESGRPVLGPWQAIFFCEFDGPRERRVHVKAIAG